MYGNINYNNKEMSKNVVQSNGKMGTATFATPKLRKNRR